MLSLNSKQKKEMEILRNIQQLGNYQIIMLIGYTSCIPLMVYAIVVLIHREITRDKTLCQQYREKQKEITKSKIHSSQIRTPFLENIALNNLRQIVSHSKEYMVEATTLLKGKGYSDSGIERILEGRIEPVCEVIEVVSQMTGLSSREVAYKIIIITEKINPESKAGIVYVDTNLNYI